MISQAIEIRNTRPATTEEWDRVWAACNYATYFHSREWAEIWETYTDGFNRPSPEMVTFSDATQALLPFTIQKRKKVATTYFLTAEGQFGNWISAAPLADEHVSLLVHHLNGKCKNLVWRWNPYDPVSTDIDLKDVYELVEDENFAVDLTGGFERVLKGCYHGHRCSYQKGKRAGLSIRLAESEADWKDYYVAYEDSLRRWGDAALSKYDWRLFNIMYQLKSPHIKLWIALYDGAVIAGALCFYAKHHVVCWHSAVVEKYLLLRPMNFMFLEVMGELCACGYRWFDFSVSGRLEGVATFKKRFGARELKCNVVYKKSRPMRKYIAIKKLLNRVVNKAE